MNQQIAVKRAESRSRFGLWMMMAWLICFIMLATDSWLLGVSFMVLLLGVQFLGRVAGPPVVLAAFLYQWLQVTIAPVYAALTGGHIIQMRAINYRPMMLIGLAAVLCYFGGYLITSPRRKKKGAVAAEVTLFPLTIVTVAYFSAIAISITIQKIAWSYPQLTQLLLVLSYIRYVLLFVFVTRLMRPKPQWASIFFVLGVEILLGFTGFFATFRDSIVTVALAIGGASLFNKKSTWISYGLVATIAFVTAIVWTSIKPAVRKGWSNEQSVVQRLDNAVGEAIPAVQKMNWELRADELVSRIWMIYYPTLAYERVPSIVPHENGELLREAVMNVVMPRMFFPNKGILPSESDKVRKYSGIWVAGRESKTSFAFGYSAESYVDFGLPWMFVPILIFGALVGLGDRVMSSQLKNPDIRNGVRVVVLWSTMYLFEQSWVIMLGMGIGLFIMLLASAVIFERALHLTGDVESDKKVRIGIPRTPVRRVPVARRIQTD